MSADDVAAASPAGGGTLTIRGRRLAWLARKAGDMAFREARSTAWGLWLALLIAPFALCVEMLIPVALNELAGDQAGGYLRQSCLGLKSDNRGFVMSGVSSIGTVLGLSGGLLANLDVNRKKLASLLPHVFIVGTATAIVGIVCTMRSPANAWQTVRYSIFIDYAVCALPYVSFSTWSYAMATRRAWRRAALTAAFGMVLGIAITLMGCLSFFYIVLSDQTTGFAGFAVNGLGYPIMLLLGRRRILALLGSRGTGSAAVTCLFLKILTSVPQFYVLTMCVLAGLVFVARALLFWLN